MKTQKKGLHLNFVRFLAKKRSLPTVSGLKPSAQVKGGGGGGGHATILNTFNANYTTLATQKGEPWPSPKNALGFGILQTAKNRSFE